VWIGRQAFGQVWDKRVGPYLIVALAAVAATIWLRFPIRENRDLVHAFFWLMTADLALSTTVHPWYLSWAAFALPFYPYAFMTYWTGSALLSYVAYGYQPVHEPPWVLCLEYLPTFGLMAWEIARGAPLLARSRSPEAA
jgi:hypothetical protein